MSEEFEQRVVSQEETGKEQFTSQNNEGSEAQNVQEKYVSNLKKVEKMDGKVSEALIEAREEEKKIRNLRESMGLPIEEPQDTNTLEHIEALEKQKENLEGEIANQEQEILQIPDSEGRNPSTLEKKMDVLDDKHIEGLEQEAREKFVQEFITSSIVEITDHFRTFLDKSQNKEAATFLIQQKITFSIQQRAKDYIENGGEPDFGFEAEISAQEFDDPTEGEVMYITEFDLTFEQSGESGEEKFQSKQELVDEETQQQIDQAKEAGQSEEIGKKAV